MLRRKGAIPVAYPVAQAGSGKGGFIFLAGAIAIAYFVWPDDVTSQTLSQMTFGSLLRVIGAGVIAFVGIGGAINLWDS